MSSDNEIIFTASNKLKSCAVSINDIALIQETISHMEFCYKNDTPVITGKLLFNDIPSGQYKLKIVDDTNGNNAWDTGNINENIMPEKIMYSKEYTVKKSWTSKEIY